MRYFVGIVLLTCANADAGTIIFDTFGPDDGRNNQGGAVIGSTFDSIVEQGSKFVVPNDGPFRLDYVELAVSSNTFGYDRFQLNLMSDLNGAPGSTIETYTFSGIDAMTGTESQIIRGNSVGTTELDSGTPYWLIGSAPLDEDTIYGEMFWHISLEFVFTPRAVRVDGGPWNIAPNNDPDPFENDRAPAYRVVGTRVPEPSGFGILAGAFTISLTRCHERRRRRIPISDSPPVYG